MKWFKRAVLVFLALLAGLALLPLVVSLDSYRPQVEAMVSDKLKEPVSLEKLALRGLPLPHVVIEGIAVGNTGDLKVGRVAVTPDLLSLLTATKVIRSIDIDGLLITQRALDKIPQWTRADPRSPPAAFKVEVQEIRLNDASLQLQQKKLGPFDAEVAIGSDGLPQRALLSARDGRLKATLLPSEQGRLRLNVDARDWTLPLGPPMKFDELKVSGYATPTSLDLRQIESRLYQGRIGGSMEVGWQKGLRLKGQLAVDAVELRDLVPLFSPSTKISGRLTAKPVFSGETAKPERIAAAMRLETPFDIRDGVLQGIDLQRAAMRLITRESGGETRFDTLSGHFAMDRGTQRISNLKVASGSLGAEGHVTIAPDKSLSGRVNAQLKTVGSSSLSVPLNISGTLDSPMALPSGAAMAGAAIGSVVMPGVGTSVGAKVGGWAEGLFGGNKDARK
jgi:uncharacterized protein involved in outer membrane biogenesis